MENIKRLFNYINKNTIILLIVLTFISTIISVFIPYILSYIIDNIISLNNIFIFLIILLILYILNTIISFITNYNVINMTEKTLYKLRKDLFIHLQRLPLSYFDKNDKGNIMSTFTNDIDKINELLSEGLTSIISSIISLIGVSIMMFYMNILLSIIVIITVPLFFIIVSKLSIKINDYFNKQQDILAKITSSSEEIISGMKTIKVLNKEKEYLEKFDRENNNLKNISIKANTYAFLVMPINILINNLGNILIIGIGSYLVLKGSITIGNILAFLTYASMFREPINDIGSMVATFGEALAGLNRIFKLMDEEIEEVEKVNFDKLENNIIFSNVNFSYNDDKMILKNINFSINKGETIALVGETGSGKTSLINLLVKFYDIDSGNIYIDSNNLNNLNRKSLRDKIGMVLQDTYLFEGTIIENVISSSNVSYNEAINVCKKIGLDKIICKLKNSYNTIINNDDNSFSEGEKQLISIARCILKNPDIIILDEATSKIDTKTEKKVYEAIKNLLKNKTSIVVAHRLSTIESADKIIVLNNGKIIEFGNHEILLNNKKDYYKLYNSQFI